MNAHLQHLKMKATVTGVSIFKYAAAQNIKQAGLLKLMKATVCSVMRDSFFTMFVFSLRMRASSFFDLVVSSVQARVEMKMYT